VIIDPNNNIEVEGCVFAEEEVIAIVLDEDVDLSSLENSPLIVYDEACGDLKVQVEYNGDAVSCDEAIVPRNEKVAQGSLSHTFILSLINFLLFSEKLGVLFYIENERCGGGSNWIWIVVGVSVAVIVVAAVIGGVVYYKKFSKTQKQKADMNSRLREASRLTRETTISVAEQI